jgi:hypothetical protein
LYADFGVVLHDNFKDWWNEGERGRKLFAERPLLHPLRELADVTEWDESLRDKNITLLKVPLTLGRGFTGVVKVEALERLYHQRLGGVMLGDLPIPFYANIWDIDHNRLLYLGSKTAPDMRLARLALVAATAQVLHNGLAVLGVSAPSKM